MARRSIRSAGKEEFWRRLIERQRRSGLSIRVFCHQNAISEPSFYAWRKQLQRRDTEQAANRNGHPRLIPVEVISSRAANNSPCREFLNAPLEIGTPRGFMLRFDPNTTTETVARLLDVLAHCPTGEVRSSPEGAAPC